MKFSIKLSLVYGDNYQNEKSFSACKKTYSRKELIKYLDYYEELMKEKQMESCAKLKQKYYQR